MSVVIPGHVIFVLLHSVFELVDTLWSGLSLVRLEPIHGWQPVTNIKWIFWVAECMWLLYWNLASGKILSQSSWQMGAGTAPIPDWLAQSGCHLLGDRQWLLWAWFWEVDKACKWTQWWIGVLSLTWLDLLWEAVQLLYMSETELCCYEKSHSDVVGWNEVQSFACWVNKIHYCIIPMSLR